jgi:hypothetical protein
MRASTDDGQRISRREVVRVAGGAVAAAVVGAERRAGPCALAASPATHAPAYPLLAFQIDDQHNLEHDSQFGSFQAVAPLFDSITLQDWPLGAGAVPILRRGRAKTLLYYRLLVNDYGGGGYRDEWYLRDAAGRKVPTGDGGSLMNPGHPAFRAYWINGVRATIERYGLDGVTIDGPAGYAHGPTWHADIVRFMREIREALPGKVIATNSLQQYYGGPDPSRNGAEFDWAASVDQYDLEVFMGTEPWGHDPNNYDPNRAQVSLLLALRALGLRKAVSVTSGFTWNPDAALKRRWQAFQYAGYLMLVGGGPVYWSWGYNFKPNYDFPELHLALGAPAGPARQEGYRWTRTFAHGVVSLDLQKPGTASITMK